MPFTLNPDTTFWQLSFPLSEEEAHVMARNPELLSKEVSQCLNFFVFLVLLTTTFDAGTTAMRRMARATARAAGKHAIE